MNIKIGNFSQLTAGDKIVSGLGFEPNGFIFIASNLNPTPIAWSIGLDTGDLRSCVFNQQNHTEMNFSTTSSILVYPSGYIFGKVTNIQEGQFTITFTRSTANARVVWFAMTDVEIIQAEIERISNIFNVVNRRSDL